MRTRLWRTLALGAVLAAMLFMPSATQARRLTCTSSSQCPTGQLCCYPCGQDGCQFMCMNPIHGHCPIIP